MGLFPSRDFHVGQNWNGWRITEVIKPYREYSCGVYRAVSKDGTRSVIKTYVQYNELLIHTQLASKVDCVPKILHTEVTDYDDQAYVVVMEDVGPSLSAMCDQETITLEDIVNIMETLASRVLPSITNALPVVHNDLSPDNVALRGGRVDDVVVLDFGLAFTVKPLSVFRWSYAWAVRPEFAPLVQLVNPECTVQLCTNDAESCVYMALCAMNLLMGYPMQWDYSTPVDVIVQKKTTLKTDLLAPTDEYAFIPEQLRLRIVSLLDSLPIKCTASV